MSDLLETAAATMGLPASLVQRSAAARAAETGASVDDILTSWTGGAPVVAAAPPEPEVEAPAAAAVETEEPAAAVAVMEPPVIEAPVVEQIVVEEEPEEPLEPVALGQRVRTAVRVGAWTGAGLGVVAFLMASAFWADTTAVLPDEGPIVQVNPSGVVIGVALVSVLFGAVVAGFSRSAAAWANPAMQLSSSKASTAWIGAGVGLVLGLIAGVTLTSFGTPIEGSEEGLTQLPVLPTLAVMLIGGALLGALTAAIPQLLGTPVAIDEEHEEEVEVVRKRLGDAMSVPMVALLFLVVLVIPFGYALIQSNHLASGGASIVGILTAGGILGFAALAGSKPDMKISLGDVMWALLGLGTVLVIVLSVLFYLGADDHEGEVEEHTSIVRLL